MSRSIAKFQDKCRHFTGIGQKACAAGVDYTTVRDESTRPYRWPCLKSDGATTSCTLASFLSDEEARIAHEQEEADYQRWIEDANLLAEGHAEVDGASVVYFCELCDRAARIITHDKSVFLHHVKEMHGVTDEELKASGGKMASHMDATEWFQTDTRFTLPDGRAFLLHSTRQPRRGTNKAIWADGTPRGKSRKRGHR